jgi:glycosyltransferase involved in cell wall biosynthesis
VLANSELTQALLAEFCAPWHTCKVYREPIWGAEWIAEWVTRLGVPTKPFAERGIDVLFVAGSWRRPAKNLPMVARIARRLAGRRSALVGESDASLPGVAHHGRIADRRTLLALMGDAKAVVAPSLIDACPNVLFEAALMGCNVVTSKNCGNWMLCNEALLVDPPCEDGYVVAVERAVQARHPDNMAWFLDQGSYAHLLQILDAL